MSPRRAALVSGMVLALAACGERSRPHGDAASATATPGRRDVAEGSGSAAPGSRGASSASAHAEGAASAAAALGNAPPPASSAPGSVGTGEGDCKVIRGPVRLTTTGAVLIGPGTGGLLAFATNKLGAPAWETPKFPEPAKQGTPAFLPKASAAPTAPLARPGSTGASASASASAAASSAPEEERSRLPACALAAGLTFCVDADGAIHRRKAGSDDDQIIAKGRKGTPVSAASAGGHTFYAFLGTQRTTEGLIARAFVGVDDEVPIPLSEEGSGATFVGLVAREKDVLAMYIDARTALTPIHARTLRFDGHLVRGNDAVVYVGSGSDGRIRGAMGRSVDGPAFLFVAGARDDKDYGVVALVVDGEPKDDLPGKWSLYPAPITTSPLAVTSGKSPVRLARVRPENKDTGAQQVLELGHVGPDGAFAEKCAVAKAGTFSDVAVEVDEKGSLWVTYTNGQGTWVEQRGGP